MKIALFWALMASIALSQTKETEKKAPIRFSVVESWIEPYAVFDSKKILVNGIVKELFEGISSKLELPFELVNFSRSRVNAAAEKGLVDIRCIIHQSWVSNPESYYWSNTLYNYENAIVWKKGTPPIKKLSDLDNKTLGTVKGYIYKTIDSMVAEGKFKRADVIDESINTGLLDKNRIDYALVELASFKWLVKNKKVSSLNNAEFLIIENIPIKCGLLKSSKLKPLDFDSAIEKLKKDGFFKDLQTKYGIKP